MISDHITVEAKQGCDNSTEVETPVNKVRDQGRKFRGVDRKGTLRGRKCGWNQGGSWRE